MRWGFTETFNDSPSEHVCTSNYLTSADNYKPYHFTTLSIVAIHTLLLMPNYYSNPLNVFHQQN
jgi:hypothetical protein